MRLLSIFMVLAASASSALAAGGLVSWTGAASGDLGDTNNWSPKTLPTLTYTAVFAVTNYCTSGSCSAGTVTNSGGYIGGGSFSGLVVNKGYIDGGYFSGVVSNLAGGHLRGTSVFSNFVYNGNWITSGGPNPAQQVFHSAVQNESRLYAGTYLGAVTNNGQISSGVFSNAVVNNNDMIGGTFCLSLVNNFGTISTTSMEFRMVPAYRSNDVWELPLSMEAGLNWVRFRAPRGGGVNGGMMSQ